MLVVGDDASDEYQVKDVVRCDWPTLNIRAGAKDSVECVLKTYYEVYNKKI